MARRETERSTPVDPSLEKEGIPDHVGPLGHKAPTGDAQEGLTPPGTGPAPPPTSA
jgi:hypothetical protein